MPVNRNNPRPCPECEVEARRNAAGLFHCLTDSCPVSYFKVNFHGKVIKIVYCADREEERV